MKLTLQWILQNFKHFIELVLPAQCLLCRLPSNNKLICKHCQKVLIQDRPCCQRCGLPLPESQPFCGDCLKQAHLFTQLHALADYQKPYPLLIKKFKYAKQLINGELLAMLLIKSVTRNISLQQISKVDYLLPVPLHRAKHRRRGFNQAQLLAEQISKQLHLSVLLDAVKRQKQTVAQEGLSLPKRKVNLKNAFTIPSNQKANLAGSYIVIIDDVVTTGATVNSLCQVLLQAGVKRIDVWCVCRTALKI
ncbi:MAG: double zinc ribbon domain-containing protein [Psychromonas sp.]|nr:double zinc ribbon domain-containing protein [Psychromonas sp.]